MQASKRILLSISKISYKRIPASVKAAIPVKKLTESKIEEVPIKKKDKATTYTCGAPNS